MSYPPMPDVSWRDLSKETGRRNALKAVCDEMLDRMTAAGLNADVAEFRQKMDTALKGVHRPDLEWQDPELRPAGADRG